MPITPRAAEAARAFAKMGKLWKIHFRNVTQPIPYFVETYIDNGYTDMAESVIHKYSTTMMDQALATLERSRSLPPSVVNQK